MPDPRVFFAAERTLLAWIRTGISIQGVGFLVAKFGLFLRLMGFRGGEIAGQHSSTWMGVLFVLTGTASIGWSVWQHRRFLRSLTTDQRPASYAESGALVVGTLMTLLGILLAIYLTYTSQVAGSVAHPLLSTP